MAPAISHLPAAARRFASRLRCAAAAAPALLLFLGAASATAIELRTPLADDPWFAALPPRYVLPDGTLELWLDALTQPDDDGRREACLALIRAHRLGIDVRQAAAEPLERILRNPSNSPVALRAALAAATALELRALAPAVQLALQCDDLEVARLAESALADWQWEPLAETWRSRIADPDAPRPQRLRAYYAAGRLGLADAAPALAERVLDPLRDLAERQVAAAALAELPGAVRAATLERLAAGDVRERRLAALLVARQPDPAELTALEGLAVDEDPVVAVRALRHLHAADPERAAAAADVQRAARDAHVRSAALTTLAAVPSAERVAALAEALDDPHPSLRTQAADALLGLATAEASPWRSEVARAVAQELKQPRSARALDQAVRIVGAAHYATAAPRLIPLLRHDAEGVRTAAAWSLAQLDQPQSGPAILERLREITLATEQAKAELAELYAAAPADGVPLPDLSASYAQAEHLIAALGRLRLADAAEDLARYVPKPTPQVRGEPPHVETYRQDALRSAALWALGELYAEGEPEPPSGLIDQIAARMADDTPIPAEAERVRQLAAVALGRMGSQQYVRELRERFDPQASERQVGRGCGWALERLTGETLPRPAAPLLVRRDWFLAPLGP